MRSRILLFALLIVLVFVTAACDRDEIDSPEDIPTRASLDALASAIPLTQNAPPAPYNLPVTTFERVDNRLNELAGWRYTVLLQFNGVFARTPREANASAQAEVWFNQLASARRITFSTIGELFSGDAADGLQYEAVRLGRDAFLVRDNACSADMNGELGDAAAAADLGAGSLIGGVRRAEAAGRRATINGQDVYAYQFAPEDLTLPAIRLAEGGRQTVTSSELWIAPAANAVVRFYVNLDVENVILLDSQLPVTGQVVIRYDLFDVGEAFNISVPFGC